MTLKGSFGSVTMSYCKKSQIDKSVPGNSLITTQRIFSFSHVFNPKRSLCLSSRGANETVSAILYLFLNHNVRKICQAGFYESLLTAWNNNLMNRGVFFSSLFFPSSESNRNKRVGAVNGEIVYSTLEQGQRTCHQPHPEECSLYMFKNFPSYVARDAGGLRIWVTTKQRW